MSGPWNHSWSDAPTTHVATQWGRYLAGDKSFDYNTRSTLSTFSLTGMTCSRSGVRTPGFRNLVSSGQIVPTTTATALFNRARGTKPASATAEWTGQDYYGPDAIKAGGVMNYFPGFTHISNPFAPPLKTIDPTDTYRRCYKKYVDNYRSLVASLGTFLGEAPEMVEQLNGLPGRLQDGLNRLNPKLDQFRRLKIKPGKRGLAQAVADVTSNALLEWNFAFAPLLSDTKSIAEAFAHVYESLEKEKRKVQASWRYSTPSIIEQLPDTTYSPVYLGGSFLWKNTLHHDEFVVSKLGSIFNHSFSNDTLSIFGMTSADIIPTAWELATGSWLVDYFIPLGEFFQAISQPAVLGVDAWQVLISETRYTVRSEYMGYTPAQGISNAFAHGESSEITSKRFDFMRSPWDGYLPTYTFQGLPGPRRLANVAAFGFQRMQSRLASNFAPLFNVLNDVKLRNARPGFTPRRMPNTTDVPWDKRTRKLDRFGPMSKASEQLRHINDWRYRLAVADIKSSETQTAR